MPLTMVEVLGSLFGNAVGFLPAVVSAVIILAIGLVVGKIVGRAVKEILERLKVDYYLTEKDKSTFSVSEIFSLITRWWIYLAFISAALSTEVLGIPQLANWITQINLFIPRIIGASVILVAGYLLGEYVKNHLKREKKPWALLTGKALFFFVLYVAVALALDVLGLSATLVGNILLVIIASVGLGVAIALGLGLKDAVAIVSKKYANKYKV